MADHEFPLLHKVMHDFVEGVKVEPKQDKGVCVFSFACTATLMAATENPSQLQNLSKQFWLGMDRAGAVSEYLHCAAIEELVEEYDSEYQVVVLVACILSENNKEAAVWAAIKDVGDDSVECCGLVYSPIMHHDGDFFPEQQCGNCDIVGWQNLRRCKGCYTARYCKEQCRAADWERHGPICSDLDALRKEGKRFLKAHGNGEAGDILGDMGVDLIAGHYSLGRSHYDLSTRYSQHCVAVTAGTDENSGQMWIQCQKFCGANENKYFDDGPCDCSWPVGILSHVRCVHCSFACHPQCAKPVKRDPTHFICGNCTRKFNLATEEDGSVDIVPRNDNGEEVADFFENMHRYFYNQAILLVTPEGFQKALRSHR